MASDRKIRVWVPNPTVNSQDLGNLVIAQGAYRVAHRTILSAEYTGGQVLEITDLPAKKIITAYIRTGSTVTTVWPSTDLSANIAHASSGGNIDVVVHYEQGGGSDTIKIATT